MLEKSKIVGFVKSHENDVSSPWFRLFEMDGSHFLRLSSLPLLLASGMFSEFLRVR
jgi:hypothetical protein